MAVRGINGSAVALTLVGVVLTYSGIKGKKISTTARDLIAGNNPLQNTAVEVPITGSATTGSTAVPDLPAGASLGVDNRAPIVASQVKGALPKANMALGKVLAAPFGWSVGPQWDALVQLWNIESGWSNTADNPSSHAYGIPQALPASKMPLLARAPYDGGIADPTTQILWGLTYIKGRYRNPVNALAHEHANGWY